jgi:hypothetical protein
MNTGICKNVITGKNTYMEVTSLDFIMESMVNGLERGAPGNCWILAACSTDGVAEIAHTNH